MGVIKMKNKKMEQTRVKLKVGNLEVFGTIAVISNGYRSRLSDLINNNHQFISLTDVEVYEDNKIIDKTPFMCINKQAIIFFCESNPSDDNNQISDQFGMTNKAIA